MSGERFKQPSNETNVSLEHNGARLRKNASGYYEEVPDDTPVVEQIERVLPSDQIPSQSERKTGTKDKQGRLKRIIARTAVAAAIVLPTVYTGVHMAGEYVVKEATTAMLYDSSFAENFQHTIADVKDQLIGGL